MLHASEKLELLRPDLAQVFVF